MANNELTIEQIKDVVETVVQREVGQLRSELHAEINGATEQIIGAFDRHMIETDTKFMSDRKRLDRLEKIVLY